MPDSKARTQNATAREQPTFILPQPSTESISSRSSDDLSVWLENNTVSDSSAIAFPKPSPAKFGQDHGSTNTQSESTKTGKLKAMPNRNASLKNESMISVIEEADSKKENNHPSKSELKQLAKEKKKREKEARKGDKRSRNKANDDLSSFLRHKLSFKSTKGAAGTRRELHTAENGISMNTEPFQIFDTTKQDHHGQLKTSKHITADLKIHVWRDTHKNGSMLDRLLRFLRRKRVRRFVKTMIDIESASLASLRSKGSSKSRRNRK